MYIYDLTPVLISIKHIVCQISNWSSSYWTFCETLGFFSVPECDLYCPYGERCEIVEIPNSGRSYKAECIPVGTPSNGSYLEEW